ncbi:recombination protein NinG [Diaphorobacter nitroreducens]
MTFRRTRCPHCKAKLEAGQRIHPECIEPWADAQAAKAERAAKKKARAAAKVELAETRRRKEAMKRLPELIAEAQAAFNAFIRARDAGLPCICCGQPFEPMKPGGSVDAGHFRSRSSAGHLRFNEDNCFAQRKNCNRPGGTTYGAFRAGVVARIGEARVAALENDNAPHKWTREELIGIRDTYRAKLKEMKK